MPKQKPNEQVQQIPLSEIRPFKNHPFKVTDDELMQQTIDSIMQVGVLNPAIIRPAPEGGYEMVAGHRRLHAADLAGLKTIPAIVRNLDDDEAVILIRNCHVGVFDRLFGVAAERLDQTCGERGDRLHVLVCGQTGRFVGIGGVALQFFGIVLEQRIHAAHQLLIVGIGRNNFLT